MDISKINMQPPHQKVAVLVPIFIHKRTRVKKRTLEIVPVPTGKMDARRVCVTIWEMLHGVMERKVFTMTTITRKMERTHLVIAIIETGNAIPIFCQQNLFQNVVFAKTIGSVNSVNITPIGDSGLYVLVVMLKTKNMAAVCMFDGNTNSYMFDVRWTTKL